MEKILIIVILLLLLVLVYLYVKRHIKQLNKKFEAEKQKLEVKNQTLEKTISKLDDSKRELQQFLVTRMQEYETTINESIQQKDLAENKLKNVETTHDGFFVETIHEMRTPLSLILGSISQIVQHKDLDNETSTQLLSAYRNTLAMQDLTDQLVGTRHANDVANYLRIARYDMVEITRQICDLFVDWVAMNNVDFRVNTQTDKLFIWIDRRKTEYSLRTLISNALKNAFMYSRVNLNLSVIKKDKKAYCALTIQDEGLDETEGTRRGLKQVSEMAENIGGLFIKDDHTDDGTQYTILIPLGKQHLMNRHVEFVEPETDLVKLNEQQKGEIAELIQIVPQKKETGKKMLIVDDSDQIRWFLKHVFHDEYQILEAKNGEEGIAVTYESMPDVILCDVMMPIKDGFEVCHEIKTNPQTYQIPIIMLTAKVESEDVVKGIENGADDYITKPFDVEVLRSKVNNLLKHREQLKRFYTRSLVPGTAGTTGEDTSSQVANVFMDMVIKNIEKYLDDPTFEAKILASSLNMSLPTLYRKIKQYSDCSILELTRSVRLKRATELLLQQQYSIQEVAEMVGFNDTATFRKRFTEQYGVTPSQYGEVKV